MLVTHLMIIHLLFTAVCHAFTFLPEIRLIGDEIKTVSHKPSIKTHPKTQSQPPRKDLKLPLFNYEEALKYSKIFVEAERVLGLDLELKNMNDLAKEISKEIESHIHLNLSD